MYGTEQCTERNSVQYRGWGGVPGTGQYCPWWPARPIPLLLGTPCTPTPPAATAVYSVYGGWKQCPGLNGTVSVRVRKGAGGHPSSLLLYPRQFWPGSQRPYQGIQGKCWIGPGTLDPGPQGLLGPEMDSIWSLLTPDCTLLTPDCHGSGPF